MTWRKVFDAPLTDASRRVDEASRGFDASRPILRTSSKNTPKASACPSKTISAPHAFRRPSSRAFSFPRRFSSSSPSCRRTPSTSPSRSSSSATAGPGTGTKSSRRSSTGFRSSCPPSLRRCFRPSCRRARPGPQDSRGGGLETRTLRRHRNGRLCRRSLVAQEHDGRRVPLVGRALRRRPSDDGSRLRPHGRSRPLLALGTRGHGLRLHCLLLCAQAIVRPRAAKRRTSSPPSPSGSCAARSASWKARTSSRTCSSRASSTGSSARRSTRSSSRTAARPPSQSRSPKGASSS